MGITLGDTIMIGMSPRQVRFYMSMALAGINGKAAARIGDYLTAAPEKKDPALVTLLRRWDEQAQQLARNPASQLFEAPGQPSVGLVYDEAEYTQVWQEIKNWALITSNDKATDESIRKPYMSGLTIGRTWAQIVWYACDNLPEAQQESMREAVRASSQSMVFEPAS